MTQSDSKAPDTANRKNEHINIVEQQDVGFGQTGTLLDGVQLLHDSLPDLDIREVDTSVQMLGKRLRIPLIIAGMTGGTARARDINRLLAQEAEAFGCGMGLGSQRAMLEQEQLTDTFAVRDVAPSVLLLGNIGVVQARDRETDQLREMVDRVGADALCVHMNPAQEIVQPEGDRDFRGGLETMRRLARDLGKPLIAKETGCGISPCTAARLYEAGIRNVDVSGAGGTSWVAVEMKRARGTRRGLGKLFREWGIPTGVSVAFCRRAGMESVIATGGIGTGVDIAKAIVLGATAAGMARPILKALSLGGPEAVHAELERIELELRTVMLLVGARDIEALSRVPRLFSVELERWLGLSPGNSGER
ncbi:MAG: type 2 isopentenyl-diphosphate Delta-isomerase [Sorangium cellulosum]|nr:MAG: type 2 isopentenyl-diphosphate Delta-isomerase [Sorangium cellulosum]